MQDEVIMCRIETAMLLLNNEDNKCRDKFTESHAITKEQKKEKVRDKVDDKKRDRKDESSDDDYEDKSEEEEEEGTGDNEEKGNNNGGKDKKKKSGDDEDEEEDKDKSEEEEGTDDDEESFEGEKGNNNGGKDKKKKSKTKKKKTNIKDSLKVSVRSKMTKGYKPCDFKIADNWTQNLGNKELRQQLSRKIVDNKDYKRYILFFAFSSVVQTCTDNDLFPFPTTVFSS
jgi:hypothetical protein